MKPLKMKEIARIFRVTPPTIRKWIEDGMPAMRANARGDWRFDIENVKQWLYEQQKNGGKP